MGRRLTLAPGPGSIQGKAARRMPQNRRTGPALTFAIQKPTGVRQREPGSEKRAKVQKLGAAAAPA